MYILLYRTTKFIMKTKIVNCKCHYKNYDD